MAQTVTTLAHFGAVVVVVLALLGVLVQAPMVVMVVLAQPHQLQALQ